jgi:hypothetical protein
MLAVLAVAGSTESAAATPPPCPLVVSDTELQTDCAAPMVIAADGVEVDLNGHHVTCAGDRSRNGIALTDRKNVRIRNGHVDGNCGVGIDVVGGAGNRFHGLHVDGDGVGMLFHRSDGNSVRNSTFAHNGLYGLGLIASNGNRVSEVSVVDNGAEIFCCGLVLDFGASDNIVRDSRIIGNRRHGIYMDFPTVARNRIEDNTVTKTVGGLGLGVHGPDNVIKGNLFARNGTSGLRVDGTRNMIEDNTSVQNVLDGISAGSFAQSNVFKGNQAFGNGNFDLADYPPGPCTLNTWLDNEGAKLFDGCEAGRASHGEARSHQ